MTRKRPKSGDTVQDRSTRPGDPDLVQCPHASDGLHTWGPDPDDPDAGDACTVCAVGR